MGEVFTREEILAAEDSATRKELVPVKVPEWGGKTVYVRAMNSAERDAYEDAQSGSMANFRARMVAATACDDKGNLLLTLQDADAMGQKSATAINRIFKAALKLNRFNSDDLEETVKN